MTHAVKEHSRARGGRTEVGKGLPEGRWLRPETGGPGEEPSRQEEQKVCALRQEQAWCGEETEGAQCGGAGMGMGYSLELRDKVRELGRAGSRGAACGPGWRLVFFF